MYTLNVVWLGCRLVNGHPLSTMGLAVLAKCPHTQALDIDYDRLATFLLAAESMYTCAPYHNARHATHVLCATRQLLHMTPLAELLQPLEVLATYVAAICHDMGHRWALSTRLMTTCAASLWQPVRDLDTSATALNSARLWEGSAPGPEQHTVSHLCCPQRRAVCLLCLSLGCRSQTCLLTMRHAAVLLRGVCLAHYQLLSTLLYLIHATLCYVSRATLDAVSPLRAYHLQH